MSADLFQPTPAAWGARPSDPNDTFLAQTVATAASEAPRPGQVGLFGVPFDGAVPGRPGARGGPAAIRAAMATLRPWTLRHGGFTPDVYDWGDVRCALGDIATTHQRVEGAALAVLDAGHMPLVLGGDHSITFPLVKAHEGRHGGGTLGVINLDAHLDMRDGASQGILNSGQSFRRLIDLGLVKGENLVEVGIRDFANSAQYARAAKADGVTIFGAEDWRAHGLATIEHAIEIASAGTDGVYLSVDIDVLDQAHAPGVSAPTPGGIDTARLFTAVRVIAQRTRLVGADIVETAPQLDVGGMTSRAAAYAALNVLAGLARQ